MRRIAERKEGEGNRPWWREGSSGDKWRRGKVRERGGETVSG
jgi:hypothetical protein